MAQPQLVSRHPQILVASPLLSLLFDLQAMQKLQNTKKLQDLADGAGLDSLLKK